MNRSHKQLACLLGAISLSASPMAFAQTRSSDAVTTAQPQCAVVNGRSVQVDAQGRPVTNPAGQPRPCPSQAAAGTTGSVLPANSNAPFSPGILIAAGVAASAAIVAIATSGNDEPDNDSPG